MEDILKILYVLFFCVWLWSRVQDEVTDWLTPTGMPPEGYPPDVVLSPPAYAAFCRDVVAEYAADGCAAPVWAVVGYEQGKHLLKDEETTEAPETPQAGYDHPDGLYVMSAAEQESIIEFTI